MPEDRPDARELVESVSEMLSGLLPSLRAYDAFQVRIGISLLAIVSRELQFGEDARSVEQAKLSQLLGTDAPLEELENKLLAWICEGDIDSRWSELLAVLRSSAENRLRIANPKYLNAHRGLRGSE